MSDFKLLQEGARPSDDEKYLQSVLFSNGSDFSSNFSIRLRLQVASLFLAQFFKLELYKFLMKSDLFGTYWIWLCSSFIWANELESGLMMELSFMLLECTNFLWISRLFSIFWFSCILFIYLPWRDLLLLMNSWSNSSKM